jgi:hypothetical protein
MNAFLVVSLISACLAADPVPLDWVQVGDDQRSFVRAPAGTPFVPWGLNYGHDGKLMEDFWASDWAAFEKDFRDMRALGANVVRVHLQYGKFMKSASEPREEEFQRLTRMLELAEKTGLYLDITGLACYRKSDVPDWYDELDESGRWDAQARFWSLVAERCKSSPAVFCYDLMNEPVVPGGKRMERDWYSGKPLGDYDFVQFIALDQAGRPRDEIARQWIHRMTLAIRQHDQRHLVTVGLLPWVEKWGHLSGFIPATVAPELDFISVHIYPEKGKVDEALAGLDKFAVGKPVVIEETFTLTCSAEELESFLRQSKRVACGWMGHYDGRTIAQLKAMQETKAISLPQAIYLGFLELFKRLAPEMTGGG